VPAQWRGVMQHRSMNFTNNRRDVPGEAIGGALKIVARGEKYDQ
jgi:hypothetical protein